MSRDTSSIYLLCFIHDRYQRLNDNLLGAFCSLMRRYIEQVRTASRDAIYHSRIQTYEDIEQGAKIIALFLDPDIDGQTPFATVRSQAHGFLSTDRIQQLCHHLSGDDSVDEAAFEWKEVDAIMAKVKRNLRPLLRFLSVQGTPAHTRLLDCVKTMSEAFERGERLPIQELSPSLIPTRARRYLLDTSDNHSRPIRVHGV